jgi:hypothetical protein
MTSNYIISNNNSKILFVVDNLKLSFSIITQLLSSQIEILKKTNNSFDYIPHYFISYSKDYIVNSYHIYIENSFIYVYYNNKFATDDNTK